MDSILRREDEAASSAMVKRPDGVEMKFFGLCGEQGAAAVGRCEWGTAWTTSFRWTASPERQCARQSLM
jgi:hypothetical protein